MVAAGTYELKFSAAQRSGNSQDFEVLLDSGVIDTVIPAGSAYAGYTVTFTVAAGSHALEFQGLDTATGGNTAFIDNIRIQLPVTPGTYRTSYVASYFDDVGRETASENVGTYGGVAWTRPGTPDARDATHLVSSMTYNSQGLEATSTDPRGIVNATFYNLLGETTETIAAYTDGTPTADTNQTTTFTYNGEGNETSQTAVMPTGTPSQTTAWVYGVTTDTGSTIDSNDLLAKEEFPDATTGDASTSASDDVEYDYDNLGETIGMTDQNGTTHSYGLDLLGRETSDSVIVLGSGVDGSVRLHTMNYDEQGDVYQMTAYADTAGMTLVNQTQDEYNGLDQLTGEYQADSGAVDTETTPETQYAYSDPTSGSLMTSMTYPNGRILHYGYTDNALDAAIGRVDFLADDDGSDGIGAHLVDYLYMGADTMVQQADANGVELTYLQQTGDGSAITSGDQYAGDEVTGLDRFGQVIDQNWVNTTTPTPTTTDRFQYDYDQDGDVLYSDNLLNASESELYHSNSTSSGDDNTAYDPLARLTDFERGTLSASDNNGGVLDTVASPTDTQDFALDAVGNQTAVTTNGTEVDNTANAKNELTANGSNDLAFDNNGNTITDESGNTYTFNAWNQIATAKNSSGDTIATYTYAANGNRITETGGGVTTDLYYNGQQIIEQRQAGTVTDQYVYNIDYVNDVLLRDDNSTSGDLGISGSGLGQRLFAQHDANFDVTALVNTSGVVVQRAVYSPYGTMTVLSPSWTSTSDAYSFHPGFQGMWQDLATGLYYTPNRDYDPATGTWREADPAGYINGSNPFETELDDPDSGVDPDGTAVSTFPIQYYIGDDNVTLLDAHLAVESHAGAGIPYVNLGLEVTRPNTKAAWGVWNRAMRMLPHDRVADLHPIAGVVDNGQRMDELIGPNLTMYFNNGYNPYKGQQDDQAVTFVQDFRGGVDVTREHPLISGTWTSVPAGNEHNANAIVNDIKSPKFTMWLPHCDTEGTWKFYFYYLNSANIDRQTIGEYDVRWDYDRGIFSYTVNSVAKPGDPSDAFDFEDWRTGLGDSDGSTVASALGEQDNTVEDLESLEGYGG